MTSKGAGTVPAPFDREIPPLTPPIAGGTVMTSAGTTLRGKDPKMTTFTVKYARGKNHIAGLDEVVNTGPDSLNYAKSACSALSKSAFWCTGGSSPSLVQVLEMARLWGGRKGVCLKCERSALAQLATQKGCPNPWHASAPGRMSMDCPECPKAQS